MFNPGLEIVTHIHFLALVDVILDFQINTVYPQINLELAELCITFIFDGVSSSLLAYFLR